MRLSVALDEGSVGRAISRLEEYAGSFEGRCGRLCEELAALGVEVAQVTVRKDTGELASGIRLEKAGEREFLVVAESPYAAFVEFGTGVVGQGTYPGDLPSGWAYDERRTPAAHDRADPTRWYYVDRDGVTRSTRGQTANAYMAQAAEEMRGAVLAKAREVFGA